jgi:hypothetical protein
MSSFSDSSSGSLPKSVGALDPPGSVAEAKPVGMASTDRRWLWALALIAATVAGVGAWAVDEPIHAYFQAPLRRVVTMGYASLRSTPEEAVSASIKNAVVAYGLLGGSVGLLLGVAGGLARHSVRGATVGGGAGLVVGAGLTALVSVPALIGYWSYFGDNPLTGELVVPLLAHAVAWAAVGVAGGLALALGVGGGREVVMRTLLGGLLGAIIGATLYEFAGAALFPLDRTTLPVSGSVGSRLLARLAVSICVVLFAVRGLTFGPPSRR